MNSIVSVLVAYNQFLILQTHQLLVFIAKNIPLKLPRLDLSNQKYNKYTVDKLPIIKTLEKLDYKHFLSEYISQYGRELKPIKPRGKNPVPAETVCPRCGAPHQYIYDNNGVRGQLLCKVCSLRFKKNKPFDTYLACPFCGNRLSFKLPCC